MEIGDRLISKRNVDMFLTKNNYYTIIYLDNNSIEILDDIDSKFHFKLRRNIQYNMPFIWDYFYRENELRKLKLKKINEL